MVLRQKTSRYPFWILCIMGSLAVLSSTLSKNPALKPFATSLETPEGFWMGVIASASTLPGIMVSLPAASLSDICGRRRFLLAAGLIFASAPFFYLLVAVWWQLILVRFYHGFATAIFVPVAEASIAELFPRKRAERISLFSSATAVGRGFAPFLGGYLLFVTNYGYHTLYLAVGLAGLTALIMALFLTEKKSSLVSIRGSKETFTRMFEGWSKVARTRSALTVSFVQASQHYTFGAAEFFLVGYLGEALRLDPLLIGVIMGSQIVMFILAKPYMGRISDNIGRRIPIVGGSILSSLPLLAIPFVSQFPILLLLSVTYGLGFATVTASTPAMISELVPSSLTGTAMGFLGTMMDVGQALGPIITGMIAATNLAYEGSFSALAAVPLFSCIIFGIHTKTRQFQK